MRLELRPSERSTTDRPLWVWHLWYRGQLVASGFARSETEARAAAEAAADHYERERERFGWAPSRWPPVRDLEDDPWTESEGP